MVPKLPFAMQCSPPSIVSVRLSVTACDSLSNLGPFGVLAGMRAKGGSPFLVGDGGERGWTASRCEML